jgi:hypothetical protein
MIELHTEFDLAGLQSASISKAFLSRLDKHLKFESILKYVALPKLTLESDSVDDEDNLNERSVLFYRVCFAHISNDA